MSDGPVSDDPIEVTAHGLEWGPMSVECRTSFVRRTGDGPCRVLGIKTKHKNLNIYVSPTGRSVRVYRDGKELK